MFVLCNSLLTIIPVSYTHLFKRCGQDNFKICKKYFLCGKHYVWYQISQKNMKQIQDNKIEMQSDADMKNGQLKKKKKTEMQFFLPIDLLTPLNNGKCRYT